MASGDGEPSRPNCSGACFGLVLRQGRATLGQPPQHRLEGLVVPLPGPLDLGYRQAAELVVGFVVAVRNRVEAVVGGILRHGDGCQERWQRPEQQQLLFAGLRFDVRAGRHDVEAHPRSSVAHNPW